MDMTIIFVNYKTRDLTINAINSVIDKTDGIEYEIFVVDNASNDGSIEAIEQSCPNINIIKSEINGGFGYANNLAIKQAKGKYILCLNTDTLLINNAIKILFEYMEANNNVCVSGGSLINGLKEPVICAGYFPSVANIIPRLVSKRIFKKDLSFKSPAVLSNETHKLKDIDYITGADICIRKSILDEVGLFDENIFMYFEETDLCKRIKDAGYMVKVVKDAKIIHLEGQSTKNQLQKQKWFKTSEMYYFKKHHPNQVWLVKLIYMILYFIDWLILGSKDSKELLKVVKNG